MSVLRLIPKVRQTAAFVAPPSSAATTAAIFSGSIVTGRPPHRPRRWAAARPARTRSWINERSNCASAPKMSNGAQSGPRIGIQKGPLFGIGAGLSR